MHTRRSHLSPPYYVAIFRTDLDYEGYGPGVYHIYFLRIPPGGEMEDPILWTAYVLPRSG